MVYSVPRRGSGSGGSSDVAKEKAPLAARGAFISGYLVVLEGEIPPIT
jgi:hypothetical protein